MDERKELITLALEGKQPTNQQESSHASELTAQFLWKKKIGFDVSMLSMSQW